MNHDHTIPLYDAEVLHRHGAAGCNAGRYETVDPDNIVPGMEPSWFIEGLMRVSVLAVVDGLPKAIYLVESGAVALSRLIVPAAWKAAS